MKCINRFTDFYKQNLGSLTDLPISIFLEETRIDIKGINLHVGVTSYKLYHCYVYVPNCQKRFQACNLTLSLMLTSSEDFGCKVMSMLLGLGFSVAVSWSENLGSGATNELFPEMSQKVSTNNFNKLNCELFELGKKDNIQTF